jgi:hypothetical protein
MQDTKHVNALAGETSPYLLQHAHNPVQWYPWGAEALERARRENKPILLSIGYSACHWCHVMAHESFEDEGTAALMNEHFVNIKVDREERPDIDKIYQTAQQLLTHRTGGWPLTMFLTPEDQVPFFGGTYFPPEPRYGMPGFRDLLARVAEYYRSERAAIGRQNEALAETLERLQHVTTPGQPDPAPLHAAVDELESIFDAQFGGFGGAPKFPHPSNLEFLADYTACRWEDGDSERATRMSRFTLERMAEGGICDQLGGGFCRYSVDAYWMIPHFEKMLYDNGPLLGLYADAWHVTREPLFRRVASETADWVMREMQSPDGGYYSSLDADSEGEEGRFYVWTPEEIRSTLTDDEYRAFVPRFGLDRPPNFEHAWHLHAFRSVAEIAASISVDPAKAETLIQSARRKLLRIRERRFRPGRDEKILTSWNALMIRGMARAALRLGRSDLGESAARAFEFIRHHLWTDGRLLATARDGRGHLAAYLDDHAFLIDAALHLLEYRWSSAWLRFAMELGDALLRDFEDAERGGFWFTSHGHEQLIQRRRDFMDDALPSGNGVAAAALLRLAHLTGEQRYLAAAERTIGAAMDAMRRVPHAHGAMLIALSELMRPPPQVILRGNETEMAVWRADCATATDTRTRCFAVPGAEPDLPGLLSERRAGADAPVTAYVCEGFQCEAPVTRCEQLLRILNARNGG